MAPPPGDARVSLATRRIRERKRREEEEAERRRAEDPARLAALTDRLLARAAKLQGKAAAAGGALGALARAHPVAAPMDLDEAGARPEDEWLPEPKVPERVKENQGIQAKISLLTSLQVAMAACDRGGISHRQRFENGLQQAHRNLQASFQERFSSRAGVSTYRLPVLPRAQAAA